MKIISDDYKWYLHYKCIMALPLIIIYAPIVTTQIVASITMILEATIMFEVGHWY